MSLDQGFLRSKVAQRIFTLFVVCALLPIGALAVFSFGQVTRQLRRQNEERLHESNKAMTMSVFERLLLLDAELGLLMESADQDPRELEPTMARALANRFSTLWLATPGEGARPLLGDGDPPPAPDPEQWEQLEAGGGVVMTGDGDPPTVWLARASTFGDRRLLAGAVEPGYLWHGGLEDVLPAFHEILILDENDRVLHTSLDRLPELPAELATRRAQGHFSWKIDGEDYLANFRTIPLGPRFAAAGWTTVLSHRETDAMGPVANFRRAFPLVVLISLWVVLLLSISLIRRSLNPLEELKKGTDRLSTGNFGDRVDVESGDEFEELATSFNRMADRLSRQFSALATISEIDRSVLSTLDIDHIIDTVLRRTGEAIRCDAVSVTLTDDADRSRIRTFFQDPGGSAKQTESGTLSDADRDCLRRQPDGFAVADPRPDAAYLRPLARRGCEYFRVLPLRVQDRLEAILCLGRERVIPFDQEDRVQARQLADQMAVALSNARLVRDLDEMNWGTLRALARTIDASSPWTAGHSERVARLAVKTGKALGMSEDDLTALERGGLLHDIGKLAVPAEILDKHEELTDEEEELMRQHTRKGAEILEPIPAYAEVIPIVEQHHEWFDGSGYPDGLAGEEIDLKARVFTIADVYDALTSERPYRDAMPEAEAVALIRERSGTHFDPRIVDVFLDVMGGDALSGRIHPAS